MEDIPTSNAGGCLTDREFWEGNWRRSLQKPEVPFAFGRLDIAGRELERKLREGIRMAAPGGATVLEVGCGGGQWLSVVAVGSGCQAHGVDYSEEGCHLAAKRLASSGVRDAVVIHADAFAYAERESEGFDFVYSLGFVEHFESVEMPLRMHARLARSSGLVFVSVPYLRGLWGWICQRTNPDLLALHLRISRAQFSEAAAACGLEVLDCGFLGPHRLTVSRSGLGLVGKVADVALAIAWKLLLPAGGRRWAGWFAHYVYVLARKPGD